jgi:dihydrofolate reductase
VTDGIESALEQAKAVAGGKNVTVMGGAELGRQYIAAGLVDEIQIHLVPVLFGAGTKMFDGLADDHIQLETVEVIQTPAAIHPAVSRPRPGSADGWLTTAQRAHG